MNAIDIADIASSIASVLAVGAAAAWFLYTTQFKPRLQFDLNCSFVRMLTNPERLLVEIQFIFENKGFVEHRLWNLNVSVHALDGEGALTFKETTKEVQFPKRLLPKTQLVPQHYGYYFVRPGVRQIITHIIDVPADLSAIRVTSSFDYHRNDHYPHTNRRLFQITKEAEA